MTNLLSGRHKYLTNKNTKKGQKVRKIIALSALKNGYYRVQILSKAVFLKWYLFFCTLYPQTSWLRKSEETREKPPKSWDFGGSKPWYLFWLHYMAAEEGFEPSQTESESVVLPLHNSPMNWLLTYCSTSVFVCQPLFSKFFIFPEHICITGCKASLEKSPRLW